MTTVITREQGYPGLSVEIIRITTTATLAQVQTAGWYNNSPIAGENLSNVDLVCICYAFGSSNQATNLFSISISAAGVVTFSLAEANVVLPTIANHIATYTNVSGTLSEDPATAISGGNIQAGLSGTAGYVASFPATALNGSFRFTAVGNAGNFVATLSPVSSLGQASVYTFPDPGSATVNMILSKTTGTQHITVGSLQVDAGGFLIGLATGGTIGTLTLYPTTTTTGSFRLISAANGGNFNVDITNAAFGQSSILTIPDPGAASASFLLSTGAANIIAKQQFLGINDVLTFGTGTWTVTRIAQGNYVSRHTPGDETSIIAIDITPQIVIAAAKGWRLDSFDYVYSIAALALDAHSATLDRIAYANNVAVSVTSIPITATLATATQANPYLTNCPVTTPAFDVTADSKYVLEITVDNSATSQFDFYGIMLHFSETIAQGHYMAKNGGARYKDLPLKMVGGTRFGRYPKISSEQSWNMIITDGFMAPFAGYKNVITIDPTGQGRAIYASTKNNKMFAVIDSNVYIVSPTLSVTTAIGNLSTTVGNNCFIAENNAGCVLFSDYDFLYTYNYSTNVLTRMTATKATISKPGYITFQNGRFIVPDVSTNLWYISNLNGTALDGADPLVFHNTSQFQGALQTKPDTCQACVRFPGKGNLLIVMGNVVTEQWQDVGAQLFPYQRTQYSNIDYGCLNAASIDENENIVCWVAGNEKSGPFILFTDGSAIQRISNDGIDFKLAQLTDPTNVYGYLFRQDGHLIYVATWPTDNISYAYDFNTKEFSTLSSEQMGAYIAKDVAYFNGNYYFISIIDGNIYQMGSNLYTYDYGNNNVFEIPRIRIPPPIRMPDQSRFISGYAGFTIEQGQFDFDHRNTQSLLTTELGHPITTQGGQPYLVPTGGNEYSLRGAQQYIGIGHNFRTNVPRIDLSLSKDGGVNYGNDVSIKMRSRGKRQNRVMWWRLGQANDVTPQFKFYGFNRFVFTDGIWGVYQ